ncbi:Asp23/Gls24 family envelope stress response protein [uncultured Enterococcus sp.]|uniref:Asp23/Gls24 family envelope stress response protein n=1 Tax=uncultured Enterococcus sp. TaxID=167972 RepID=UPI002AA7101D|nr:Asp23/Gls24 family envelope stress response protein [uncultured Enterococcus sp.]
MAEKETIDPALTFEEKILETIVEASLNNIDGLLSAEGELFPTEKTAPLAEVSESNKGLTLEVEKRQVKISVAIVIEFGKNLSKIFREIKREISEEIQRMTNLEVVEVNVHVADIITKEAYEKALAVHGTKTEESKTDER